MKFSKKQKNQFISQVVILSVIFGFAAGVVGQIVADVYIDPWRQDYINQSLNTNQNISSPIPELKRLKRFLGIQQDFEVNKSVQQALPSLIGIYLKKKSSSNILDQIYLSQDLLGNGFILTSDGWLVTHQLVISNLNSERLVVVYNNQQFSVDQIVADSMTDIIFLKISASNLPVSILGDSDENTAGQLALVINALAEVTVTNIKDPNYQPKLLTNDFVLSSEKYAESILLESNITKLYLGSPLLNLAGEVTGIIKEINLESQVVTAVPINQFRPVILNVLKDSLTKRPYLGVEYLNLAATSGLDSTISQNQNQGALVFKKPTRLSPAAEVGLKINDIILSVDGQPVDKDNDLTELIQQYQPGDELNLEILRDGKEEVIKVILSLWPE